MGMIVALVGGAAIAVDAISKVAGSALLVDGPLEVGPVTLKLAHNPGFAFGIGARAPGWLVLSGAVVATTLIVLLVLRGAFGGWPAGLIVGGAVANVVDRALDGTVVDLIKIGSWPTFNIADALIVAGIVMVLAQSGRVEADDTQPDERWDLRSPCRWQLPAGCGNLEDEFSAVVGPRLDRSAPAGADASCCAATRGSDAGRPRRAVP
jgi:signal peptidase II